MSSIYRTSALRMLRTHGELNILFTDTWIVQEKSDTLAIVLQIASG
jgi:hypothetical protein